MTAEKLSEFSAALALALQAMGCEWQFYPRPISDVRYHPRDYHCMFAIANDSANLLSSPVREMLDALLPVYCEFWSSIPTTKSVQYYCFLKR